MQLILDPLIRNWVLLPLTVIIVLVCAMRLVALQLIRPQKAMKKLEVGQRQLVARSKRLRDRSMWIEKSGFDMRKVRAACRS